MASSSRRGFIEIFFLVILVIIFVVVLASGSSGTTQVKHRPPDTRTVPRQRVVEPQQISEEQREASQRLELLEARFAEVASMSDEEVKVRMLESLRREIEATHRLLGSGR